MKVIGVSEFILILTFFAASFISIGLIIFAGWVMKNILIEYGALFLADDNSD